VNLSVSTSVCFSSFLFISNDQLYWLLPPSALTTLITLKERHLVEVTVTDTESSYRLHLLYRWTNDTEHN